MSRFILHAVVLTAASLSLFAQPVVSDGGILNAASYTSPRLPGGSIAQGSIFVVFGTGLGPTTLASASSLPLTTSLGGTSVRVTSGSQNLDCPLVYTSARQLAAILPSTTPVGNATLTVTYSGATSVARTFRVVNSSFGTFSLNQGGSGPGVITNFESATSQPVNTALKPARPGQTLILYGTGLGPLPAGNSDAAAAPFGAINQANVELFVGGRRASVAYAGRAPGFVGLDQINFVVPTGIEGCSVPVGIKIGNVVSNYTSIAIAATTSVCQDPLGLSSSQLQRIADGGTLKLGTIALARVDLDFTVPGIGSLSIKTDSGNASFVEYNAATINSGVQLGVEGVSSVGTCYVYTGTTDNLTPTDPIQPRGLNAGALINISGPRGAKTLKPVAGLIGTYTETLAQGGVSIPGFPTQPGSEPYLEPGTYTFNNGAGGPDVGAFNTSFNLASNVVWSNKAGITNVNRTNGLTVNWTGGDASSFVQIYGYSASGIEDGAVVGFFTCLERASAGTFNVPAAILLALPATPASAGGLTDLPTGVLGVGGVSALREFNAPGLDSGYITALSVSVKSVNYQ